MMLSLVPWIFAAAIFLSWFGLLQKRANFSVLLQVLASAVFALAQIVAISLACAFFGLYRFELVYGLNALLAGLMVFKYRPDFNPVRTALKAFIGHVTWPTKLLTAIAAVLIIWLVAVGAIMNDTSFDSQNYHLSWAAYAVQEEHFGPFETPVPWINVYPKNLDAWYAWILLIPGHDWLVDLGQISFVVLGCLAVYALLREMRYSEDVAWLSALTYAFLPVVIQQATTNYIDLALASLTFVLFVFALQPRGSYLGACIVGLTSGILIGSKSVMILPVVLAWAIALVVYRRSGLYARREYIRLIGCLFIPAFALSAYWYFRNFIDFGSILYPFSLSLGPLTLLPGVVSVEQILADSQPQILRDVSLWTNAFINTYQEAAPKYDMVPGGFGPLWAWLMVPSTLVAIFFWVADRQWTRLAAFVLTFAVFALMPGNWWWRYVIILAFAGILAVAEVLSRLRVSKTGYRSLQGILLILACWSVFIARWPDRVDEAILARKLRQGITQRDFSHRYGPLYQAIAQAQTEGSRFAYDSTWFVVYPLWNSERTNSVLHVPFGPAWEYALSDKGITHVAAKSGSPEYAFIQRHAARFSLIEKDGIYSLYAFHL